MPSIETWRVTSPDSLSVVEVEDMLGKGGGVVIVTRLRWLQWPV